MLLLVVLVLAWRLQEAAALLELQGVVTSKSGQDECHERQCYQGVASCHGAAGEAGAAGMIAFLLGLAMQVARGKATRG